jgi:Zn-dependent protease
MMNDGRFCRLSFEAALSGGKPMNESAPTAQPTPSLAGSIRLFKASGILVYVHWSWLLVAYFEVKARADLYTSQAWNVAEYLTLFVIVLLHEFGHALACRQVGGVANEIVLWPLGGIAFVNPPPRPGAWLWSIAAGPLVNVVLVPVTLGAYLVAASYGLREMNPDALHFLRAAAFMNAFLLIFNMLPIYPLDGGQILQALLWFVIGRAKSLMIVSVIGMLAAAGVVALAVLAADVWLGILAAFVATRSWSGFQQARQFTRLASLPRHSDVACPSCQAYALAGDIWGCEECGRHFDTFTHRGICPGCGNLHPEIRCPECGQVHPLGAWFPEASSVDRGGP